MRLSKESITPHEYALDLCYAITPHATAANLAREHWKSHANPESCIANNAQIPNNALIGMHYSGFVHYFQYSSRDLRVISNAPEPNSQQWHCFIWFEMNNHFPAQTKPISSKKSIAIQFDEFFSNNIEDTSSCKKNSWKEKTRQILSAVKIGE